MPGSNTVTDSEDDATMMSNPRAQHRRQCWSPKCTGELASTDKFGLCDNCRRRMVDGAKWLGAAALGTLAVVLASTKKNQSEEGEDADSSEDDTDEE